MRIMPYLQGADGLSEGGSEERSQEGQEGELGAGGGAGAGAQAFPFQLSCPGAPGQLGGRNQAEVSVHQLTLVSVVRPPCLVVLAWPAIGTSEKRQFPQTGQEIQEEDGSCLLDTY